MTQKQPHGCDGVLPRLPRNNTRMNWLQKCEMKPKAFPLPPYESWGRADMHHIGAIFYHWDNERMLYHPHSVFTTEEPGSRHFCSWDFQFSDAMQQTYFHMSGSGGMPYTSPLCDSPRCRQEFPQYQEPGPKSAVWWNPQVCDGVCPAFILEGTREKMLLTPTMLRHWGWKAIPRPAVLNRETGCRNPFQDASHGTVFYCNSCKSWLPNEGIPCEHVWESHCADSGCLSGPIEDPACDCATEEACREKAEQTRP